MSYVVTALDNTTKSLICRFPVTQLLTYADIYVTCFHEILITVLLSIYSILSSFFSFFFPVEAETMDKPSGSRKRTRGIIANWMKNSVY